MAEARGRTEAVEDGEGTTGKTAFPRVSGWVVADNSEGFLRVRPSVSSAIDRIEIVKC